MNYKTRKWFLKQLSETFFGLRKVTLKVVLDKSWLRAVDHGIQALSTFYSLYAYRSHQRTDLIPTAAFAVSS